MPWTRKGFGPFCLFGGMRMYKFWTTVIQIIVHDVYYNSNYVYGTIFHRVAFENRRLDTRQLNAQSKLIQDQFTLHDGNDLYNFGTLVKTRE